MSLNRLAMRIVFVALILMVMTSGCSGPKEGTVHGKVSYMGKPVTSGVVNLFDPASGVSANANLDANGNFKVSGPVAAGSYKVTIMPPPPQQLPPGSEPPQVEPFPLPPKYQDSGQTPITKEVTTGSNELALDLKE